MPQFSYSVYNALDRFDLVSKRLSDNLLNAPKLSRVRLEKDLDSSIRNKGIALKGYETIEEAIEKDQELAPLVS